MFQLQDELHFKPRANCFLSLGYFVMQMEKLAMATDKGKFAITFLVLNMNSFNDTAWNMLLVQLSSTTQNQAQVKH